MATLRDVAERAGSSVSAVSAVLNSKTQHNIRVSEITRARIVAVAEELGYKVNPLARSLVTRKTGVLGLAFPYSRAFLDRNPFCSQIMAGVLEAVVVAGYNVMLHTAIGTDWNHAAESALLDPRVDGLILVLPAPDSAIVMRCHAARFPFVTVAYSPDAPDIPAVNADDETGGYLATRHLIEQGHRRIAHLLGSPRVATTEPRRRGYLRALAEFGLPCDPALLVPADLDWKQGYTAMQELLALPEAMWPTALFAANDLCAEGAMRVLREHGLRVPHDMAVVGYDDTWFATMTQPPLTSVSMPIHDMGTRAVQMLTALVEKRPVGDLQPVLPVTLTVRESSLAPTP